jgi:threonine dehydratase
MCAVITRADVEAAAGRIGARVRRTPVVEVRPGLWLKLELVQHTGSFKPRGMFNRVLASEVPASGLVIASGGNAGLAAAYVAQQLGHRIEVFVPETAPEVKVARLRSYGAQVVLVGSVYADALAASERRRAETGGLLVHAYDQPEVAAGQGTLARELSEQVPNASAVLVAVGGGGLVAGIAAWYAGGVRVVGVETEGCPTLSSAVAAGSPVDVATTGVAADSLGARRLGDVCWEQVTAGHIGDALVVSDEATLAARRWLWQQLRLVVEPGTATAMAALLSGAHEPADDETVVVVLCGANTDPSDRLSDT